MTNGKKVAHKLRLDACLTHPSRRYFIPASFDTVQLVSMYLSAWYHQKCIKGKSNFFLFYVLLRVSQSVSYCKTDTYPLPAELSESFVIYKYKK